MYVCRKKNIYIYVRICIYHWCDVLETIRALLQRHTPSQPAAVIPPKVIQLDWICVPPVPELGIWACMSYRDGTTGEKKRVFSRVFCVFCFFWWLLPTCDFKARPYVVKDLQKHWFFPHVLMISANLANQWNPKHFHKMSEISQNTVFFHVFFGFQSF